MEKKVKFRISRRIKLIGAISLIIYLWFLISTLLLPLSQFLRLPKMVYFTIYNLSEFPITIFGLILCVSILSSIPILIKFRKQKTLTKILLINGVSFILYFIIPLIVTIFLLVLITLQPSSYIPTETKLLQFLENLFLFTTTLFSLTFILNIATQRVLQTSNCCLNPKKNYANPKKKNTNNFKNYPN